MNTNTGSFVFILNAAFIVILSDAQQASWSTATAVCRSAAGTVCPYLEDDLSGTACPTAITWRLKSSTLALSRSRLEMSSASIRPIPAGQTRKWSSTRTRSSPTRS